ncbi:MAG: isoprenylcysteine carboxylmethyltransferase family protein [Myxococcota bacterium]
MLWRAVTFVLVTAVLAFVSRSSLRHPRSHGFFRFVAWEAIAALFLVNVAYWLVDPFGPRQLVAWFLLVASCVPVVWGTMLLRRQGRPVAQRPSDASLLAFERTTQLVTSGIYRYIRHPLYSSLLLLTWGIFFKRPSMPGALLGLVSTVALVLTARADEAECVTFFGPEYRAYMRRTRRFIPFVI